MRTSHGALATTADTLFGAAWPLARGPTPEPTGEAVAPPLGLAAAAGELVPRRPWPRGLGDRGMAMQPSEAQAQRAPEGLELRAAAGGAEPRPGLWQWGPRLEASRPPRP